MGADARMGLKLHATFVAAGLPAPTMRLESVIAGGATSASQVHLETDVVGTLIADIERLGLAARGELEPDRLAAQVFAEATATNSVIVGRADVGAWSRAI
jgi:hypothetical protein